MTRQMVMVGFLQAQNCTNLPSSWRHPESRDDSMSADYYQEIARILEAGKFHMAFFDDRLAMPDRYGNDHAHTVEYGIRCVKMDPVIVLTTMGMATEKLGLASTCSTTYYEPFDVARRFADPRSDDRRPRRLERRDLGQRRRSPQYGQGRPSRPRLALRPRRRIHGGGARPLGYLGRRRARSSTRRAAASPIRPRSSGSITRDNSSSRAGRSRCRAPPRAIPSSSRPAPAAAASALPDAGAK